MTTPFPDAGAQVVVLGVARSGEAAARALLDRGAAVRVLDGADGDAQRDRASRLGGAEIVLGREDPADIAGAELVVTSPGVPWGSGWLQAARAAGIPVWSEVELAYRLGVQPLIAVTGTNGKTTTTEMIVAALREDGRPAVAAGNIGAPLIEAGPDALVVAELSSFQLAAIESFRAPVTVLLNLAPDHLDWHGSFDAYGRAKARIVENLDDGDVVVVRADPVCDALISGTRARRVPFWRSSVPVGGAGVEDGWIVVPQGRIVPVAGLAAAALSLREDAIAAAAAAAALGADLAAIGRALAAYRPLPHRLEPIGTVGGVHYINDSKATDPHATLAALAEVRDVVLIAGGRNRSKHLPDLTQAASVLRAVVALGEAAGEVEAAFAGTEVPVHRVATMEEAVERAASAARPGDTVLLSPACASMDMFDGYEARGEAFRAAVKMLEGSDA